MDVAATERNSFKKWLSMNAKKLGGVIHTYQKYDPQRFPSPTQPPPDIVSSAFDHLLTFGKYRELTDEELAKAIRIDPSQIKGFGPSIDALIAMLLERKRKILEKIRKPNLCRVWQIGIFRRKNHR